MEDPLKREWEKAQERLAKEAESLRMKQAKRVMPLIGPLLDEFDQLPGDIRTGLEEDASDFVECLNKVLDAMEGS